MGDTCVTRVQNSIFKFKMAADAILEIWTECTKFGALKIWFIGSQGVQNGNISEAASCDIAK